MRIPEMTIWQAFGLIGMIGGIDKLWVYWMGPSDVPLWFRGTCDVVLGIVVFLIASWFSARKTAHPRS